MQKIKCKKCPNRRATWFYMPAPKNEGYCDDCVPRGCSCNLIEDEESLDEKGRRYPCCEYLEDKNGWDDESSDWDDDNHYW